MNLSYAEGEAVWLNWSYRWFSCFRTITRGMYSASHIWVTDAINTASSPMVASRSSKPPTRRTTDARMHGLNIEAVSLEDVRRIGAELVQPDRLSVLVVGDRTAVEDGLRSLDLPLKLLDGNGAAISG